MTKNQMKVLLKSQQGELDAVLMYNKLAEKTDNELISSTLKQLAAEEGHHASVFYKLSGKKLEPKSMQANFVNCVRVFVGWKKLCRLMANGEYKAYKKYEKVVKDFAEVESVQEDENRHGDILVSLAEKL
ncbi:MAG: rubrerythrin [Treponemataceae bacterium]|nr:rubrerythrin [Treponemataceae bacterium]